MLPIKMELSEKVAATLRRLRLEHPVNGEILTAEKLSKAIGNNRAWMSQIESRRLKRIKREDIIAMYKLLHNEPDDEKAEFIAEMDLFSTFVRHDSEKNNSSFVQDSYSEGIISLDNLISDLRDTLLEEYKKLEDDNDRNAMIGCVESMIDNFKNDYRHTHLIYSVPIGYADPEYFGEDYAKEYSASLDVVYKDYALSLNEAFTKTDIDSFLKYCIDIYNNTMEDLNDISPNELFDYMDVILEVEHYSKRIFCYIDRVQNNKHTVSTIIGLDTMFEMLINMIQTLLNKLKLDYPLSNTVPTFQSDKGELDTKQLEITNAIMLIIKHVSLRKYLS